MNKFAEVMFGKIANLYETSRTIEDFRKLFVPAALIIDVTAIEDVGIGYVVDFTSESDFEIIPPKKILPKTLEEAKIAKIQEMKAERDIREQAPIEYKNKKFDYDLKSVTKLNEARDVLIVDGGKQMWITYDNSIIELDANNITEIKRLGKDRSNALHMTYAKLKEHINSLKSIEDVGNVTFDDIRENCVI